MVLPYGATRDDLEKCISIVRNITGKQEVTVLATEILNIIYSKGGDYSEETIRCFSEAYLK